MFGLLSSVVNLASDVAQELAEDIKNSLKD